MSKSKSKGMFEQLASLSHELNRIRGIDRGSFWGRLEILEYFSEKEHDAIGERWRKFGRYGNIVVPAAFEAALWRTVKEANFTRGELEELSQWLQGQCKSYGNPD